MSGGGGGGRAGEGAGGREDRGRGTGAVRANFPGRGRGRAGSALLLPHTVAPPDPEENSSGLEAAACHPRLGPEDAPRARPVAGPSQRAAALGRVAPHFAAEPGSCGFSCKRGTLVPTLGRSSGKPDPKSLETLKSPRSPREQK